MPKVSSAPEDAYRFKGSFEEGWGTVVGASFLNFQFPPTKEAKGNRPAGSQDPPQLMCRLEIQRYIDGEGNKNPAPPEEVLLPIQKPDKMTGELTACHPGKYPDGNVEGDPEDMGGDLGAEGDTLYAMQDGYAINEKCKYMRFTQSLQEKGFKPAILKRTWAADLVGLYGFFKNVQVKGQTAEFDGTAFVVDKIVRFPYEKTAGGAGDKAKPAAKGKAGATAVAAAAPAAAAATTASNDFDADETIMAIMTDTLGPAKTGQTLKDMKKVRLEALMALNKHKPAVESGNKKAVMDAMTEAKLKEIGEATGTFAVADDGSVTFA